MSANYTFINVCFFYFTQYAVTHVVMSVKTPLGTGIAWTTEVLFLAVRWISGLWKILFQVLGFTPQYLFTLMLKLLYQKVVFIHCIHNPKSCSKDPDIILKSS